MHVRNCLLHLQTSDRHSSMINATSRLAVNIRYVPDSINWEDTTAQRARQSLTINDFTPTDRDGIVLQQHATHYVMGFLVSAFQSLSDLKVCSFERGSPSCREVSCGANEDSV